MKKRPIKIMVIFGTRPEAIKLLPVIIATRANHDLFDPVIVTTAQHREMMDQVLNIFDIKPDYDLNIMSPNQSLGKLTSKIIDQLDEIMKIESPDIVLVQGDTTTTFAGGLTAFYHKIKVGHVEAGLRTWNKYSPFPEEVNRKLTSSFADLHFAPTTTARENLRREGISEEAIFVTGNTGIDTLFKVLELKNSESLKLPVELDSSKLILVTAHRRESFGNGFINICSALAKIAERNKDVQIVYPVHLNPNVQNPVKDILVGREGITLIEPLDYIDFVPLMNKSYLVLTDSGGIQEEAPALGKPVLVMRENTERPEAVEVGTAKLVGTEIDRIVEETENLLFNADAYKLMANSINPYGDGTATTQIMDIISKHFHF